MWAAETFGLYFQEVAGDPLKLDVVPIEELGQEGGTYLAYKGYKLGSRWALIQAQPELRVVIRSHGELDVS